VIVAVITFAAVFTMVAAAYFAFVVKPERDAVGAVRRRLKTPKIAAHATALGDDFEGYRNHAYRVANLCAAQLRPTGEEVEKVAVAAAFHDPRLARARGLCRLSDRYPLCLGGASP